MLSYRCSMCPRRHHELQQRHELCHCSWLQVRQHRGEYDDPCPQGASVQQGGDILDCELLEGRKSASVICAPVTSTRLNSICGMQLNAGGSHLWQCGASTGTQSTGDSEQRLVSSKVTEEPVQEGHQSRWGRSPKVEEAFRLEQGVSLATACERSGKKFPRHN